MTSVQGTAWNEPLGPEPFAAGLPFGAGSVLDPLRRDDDLAELTRDLLDVLVVGGGATGAGAALDAASRGLTTALLEGGDLASGTSSNSSRLLHGGVRYLEQLEFGLVREALHERGLLQELAPHLVQRMSFLYPLTHRVWERGYVGAGLTLYDALAGLGDRHGFRRHRHLTRKALLRQAPQLRGDAAVGALSYDDGHVDDARLVLALARTAAREGATVLSRVRVTGLATRPGHTVATCVDTLSGERFTVRARRVVLATGPWSGLTQKMLGTGPVRVRASKGVHLVLPRERLPMDSALIARTPSSVLFIIPTGDVVLLGTTDTPWDNGPGPVLPTGADVRYLLDQANQWLREPLTPDDVLGVYAGLRPLVDQPDRERTQAISREHVVREVAPGCVVVAGGKLTTYRVMARDAVDAAVAGLPAVRPSATEHLPLSGASGFHQAWARRDSAAAAAGLPAATVERLARRYGAEYPLLLAMGRRDPALLEPVPGAPSLLAGEVLYAARHEAAMTVDDVLRRRTRTGLETADGGAGAAPHVAALLATALGRDESWAAEQAASYTRAAEVTRAALDTSDDTELAPLLADLAGRWSGAA
ncbi:glycerol-3-phosphate dehydrogenase [Sphaerisporangium krabiense]|uniref:Glycerol-3-phosphate dehydrogenase n=1 Tax=Sphaerisporangium krabiense TaxID=763782 RepID=A0A7W8Z248_9ACTN|nr:glycerol-3-phosphate dehydrogenase/oxidase [Sphaerisporangium krabiense]MBB5625985.1 glycerol-3-phosphate dehydrogenase [Sphaerisporangium krabiense]GII64788.1 glycerol-3-phosphate dehydrogenase [Sphaerisporangium krabiense]